MHLQVPQNNVNFIITGATIILSNPPVPLHYIPKREATDFREVIIKLKMQPAEGLCLYRKR